MTVNSKPPSASSEPLESLTDFGALTSGYEDMIGKLISQILQGLANTIESLAERLAPMGGNQNQSTVPDLFLDLGLRADQPFFDLPTHPKEGVDRGVAGDENFIVAHTLPQQVLTRSLCRREMQVGQDCG